MENNIVVHRIPLTDLTAQDISDGSKRWIADDVLQAALFAATKGLDGTALRKALIEFSKSHPVFKGICHVMVRENLKVVPIRDKNGHVYKAYQGGANSLYEIWQMPDGEWVSSVVSMFDAHCRDFKAERPHPAARKVLSLRHNDMVALEHNWSRRVCYVKSFYQSGVILLVDHKKIIPRNKAPNNNGDFFLVSPPSLKSMKVRQIYIDEIGHILDPGPLKFCHP